MLHGMHGTKHFSFEYSDETFDGMRKIDKQSTVGLALWDSI